MLPGHGRAMRQIAGSAFGLSPTGRIVVGVMLTAVGVGFTIYLWGRGVIWGMAIFLSCLGPAVAFSGVREWRRRKDRERQEAMLKARRDELAAQVLELKASGQDGVRWLIDQGLTEIDLRGVVLKLAREKRVAMSTDAERGGGARGESDVPPPLP